jgi:aminoglycoside phosphotransferase (APT) family kinase protein
VTAAPAFIPVDVADITAAWLEEVLQPHAPGARIGSIAIAEAHSGTTGRARVALTHDDARLPGSVFVKLPPFDEGQRKFVEAQGMGRAEARFYAELAQDVPVRVPRTFHASHDDQGRYVMVLENLQALGARYPSAKDPHLASFVQATIDAFAALHASFTGSPRFAEGGDLAWVEQRSRSYGSAAPLVRFAVQQLGDALPPASRELAAAYVPRAERIPALLAAGTPTLIHGDAHIGNMFVLGDTPGFLDWAMVSAAPGMRDVAYFLGGSVGTELRRARERDLVARYCRQLGAHGVVLAEDDAWQQYRLNLLTAWIAALVTAAMGSHWQPIEIGMAATRRADAAIADHDVAELLRTRLP